MITLRWRRKLTARSFAPPQSRELNRKVSQPCGGWRRPPQGERIHGRVSSFTAKRLCLPQGRLVRRKVRRSAARQNGSPQDIAIHRKVELFTAGTGPPPRLRGVHRKISLSTARALYPPRSEVTWRKAPRFTARRLSLPQGGTTRRKPPTAEGEDGAPPFSSKTGVRRGGINASAAEPVEVEFHRARTEVKCAAEPRPLVKSLVQKPGAEPVFSLIDYGRRRLTGPPLPEKAASPGTAGVLAGLFSPTRPDLRR